MEQLKIGVEVATFEAGLMRELKEWLGQAVDPW